MSETNLRTAFKNWMKLQRKSNNEPYKQSTIDTYVNCLKNGTAKLDLGNEVFSDLFQYTSTTEYAVARSKIINAPDFETVNRSYGNSAYSTGLGLYGKFLEEKAGTIYVDFSGKSQVL